MKALRLLKHLPKLLRLELAKNGAGETGSRFSLPLKYNTSEPRS